LEAKAAALLHSLVRNHALVDGNERLGWLADRGFLDLNGSPPSLTTRHSNSSCRSPKGHSTWTRSLAASVDEPVDRRPRSR